MTSTGRTKNLFSNHEVAVVHVHLYGLWLYGVCKARPTAAAVVLEVRVKDGVSTALAGIDACFLIERVSTGEGSFSSFLVSNILFNIETLLSL